MVRVWILRWDECRRSQQPAGYHNLWDNYDTRPLPLRAHASQWALATFLLLCLLPIIWRPLIGSDGSGGSGNETMMVMALIWLCQWNISFAYVSGVLSRRVSPLRGRHMGFHDIIAINLYAVCMIYHLQLSAIYDVLANTYSQWTVMAMYIACTGVWFMVLHLSLLTNVVLPSIAMFSLTASRLKILPRWIALPALSLLGGVIGCIGYAIIHTGRAWHYTMIYTSIIVVIVVITVWLRDQFHLWFHHWAVAALLLPLTAPVLALVFHIHDNTHMHDTTYGWGSQLATLMITSILASFLIEGAARWSLAPLWHVRGA